MSNTKKLIIISVVVAVFSQAYIDILVSDFRISFAVILFSIFLYLYQDLNAINLGILAGIAVYIWRVIIYAIGDGCYTDVIWSYFPEIFFYILYGIIFTILI